MEWKDRRTNIQKLIDETGVDSKILSEEIQLSYSLLRKYASGSRVPSKYACEELAKYFRVSEDVIKGKSQIMTCAEYIEWNTVANSIDDWDSLSPVTKSVVEEKISDLFNWNKEIKTVAWLFDFSDFCLYEKNQIIFPLCSYVIFSDDTIGLVYFIEEKHHFYVYEVQTISEYAREQAKIVLDMQVNNEVGAYEAMIFFSYAEEFLECLYEYEFNETYCDCFDQEKVDFVNHKYCLDKVKSVIQKALRIEARKVGVDIEI